MSFEERRGSWVGLQGQWDSFDEDGFVDADPGSLRWVIESL